MKVTTAIAALFLALNGNSQVLFTETFNETNGSATGSDNTNGVNWTAVCPGSIAATDYFHVQSGRLEARDTNGPAASWTTDTGIDITSCNSLSVSFEVTESGTMEACGTGCNSADFVAFEYSIDGGGWISPSNSYSCGGPCTSSSGNVITDDDGNLNYTTGCISLGGGSTMQLRIQAQSWAASEYWRIDNIVVSCTGCNTLPIELSRFEATKTGSEVLLEWETISETNNDFFSIERSLDAQNWQELERVKGAGNSIQAINYEVLDRKPLKGTSYYRLKQTDFNGDFTYSDIRSVNFEGGASLILYPNPAKTSLTIQGDDELIHEISVFSSTGQDVTSRLSKIVDDKETIVLDLTQIPAGVYIVKTKLGAHKLTKL